MSATTQARRPAGSPDGGQFSETSANESDQVLLGSTSIDGAELAAMCETAVRRAYWRASPGGSHDSETVRDTAGDLALAVLERPGVHVTTSPEAYITGMARHLVSEKMRRGHHRSDIAARAELANRKEGFRSEHHREPTRQESDAMVADIRDNWDTSNKHGRPSAHFHVDDHYLAPHTLTPGPSHTLIESLAPQGLVYRDDPQPHDAAQALAEQVEAARATGAANSKRAIAAAAPQVWDILADSSNAPDNVPNVVKAHIPHGRVSQYRSAVLGHTGGVLGAAAAWESGADNAVTDALFAPFETPQERLTEDERQGVVDMLHQYRPAETATAVWASAMTAASRRVSRTSRTESTK